MTKLFLKWTTVLACLLFVVLPALADENPHVPDGLREAIIAEARENSADEDWDIPAIEEGLEELKKTGDIKRDSLAVILEFAPENGEKLPIQVAHNDAKERSRLAKEGVEIIREILDALKN